MCEQDKSSHNESERSIYRSSSPDERTAAPDTCQPASVRARAASRTVVPVVTMSSTITADRRPPSGPRRAVIAPARFVPRCTAPRPAESRTAHCKESSGLTGRSSARPASGQPQHMIPTPLSSHGLSTRHRNEDNSGRRRALERPDQRHLEQLGERLSQIAFASFLVPDQSGAQRPGVPAVSHNGQRHMHRQWAGAGVDTGGT